jgi:hypothetical protein
VDGAVELPDLERIERPNPEPGQVVGADGGEDQLLAVGGDGKTAGDREGGRRLMARLPSDE